VPRELGGGTLSALVPRGARPGDVFDVRVGVR
jgi:hypothetical protein